MYMHCCIHCVVKYSVSSYCCHILKAGNIKYQLFKHDKLESNSKLYWAKRGPSAGPVLSTDFLINCQLIYIQSCFPMRGISFALQSFYDKP